MAIDLWSTRPYWSRWSTPTNQMLDRMWEQAFTPSSGNSAGSAAADAGFRSLPVNIWETSDAYNAALLAPGIDEQSINVTVHEDTLTIEGELKVQAADDAQIVWQEFAPVKFRRSLRLGSAVDPGKVEARYNNGVLLVTMAKAEHARPRQVQVQVQMASGAAETKKLSAR
jgi:HSP20 family protein